MSTFPAHSYSLWMHKNTRGVCVCLIWNLNLLIIVSSSQSVTQCIFDDVISWQTFYENGELMMMGGWRVPTLINNMFFVINIKHTCVCMYLMWLWCDFCRQQRCCLMMNSEENIFGSSKREEEWVRWKIKVFALFSREKFTIFLISL